MRRDRLWMYRRYRPDGRPNPEFRAGLETFIQFAQNQLPYTSGPQREIRCPCVMCESISLRDAETVRYHVTNYGFAQRYDTWRYHGETETPEPVPVPLPLVEEDGNMDNNASVADSTTTSHFNPEAHDQRLLKLEQQLQEERQRLQDLVKTQQQSLQELLSQSTSASGHVVPPPS